VRNLPAGVTSAALHPVVAPAQAGLDLQEDLEHGWIGLVSELALRASRKWLTGDPGPCARWLGVSEGNKEFGVPNRSWHKGVT